jgi:hypothetical protein
MEHKIRTKNGIKTVNLTHAKAIKAKCMDCSCWQREEITNCTVKLCPLYPYRGWINLGPKKIYTEEERQAMTKRLEKARSKKPTRKNCIKKDKQD